MDYIKEVDKLIPSLFGKTDTKEVVLGDARHLLELLVGTDYLRYITNTILRDGECSFLRALVLNNDFVHINQMDDQYLLNEFLVIYVDDYGCNLESFLKILEPLQSLEELIKALYNVVVDL